MAEPIFTIMAEDPHIVTFRGDEFDFMGEHGKWYNFLSAGTVQLNAKMTTFESNRTYISAVGLKLGHKLDAIHLVHAQMDGDIIAFDLADLHGAKSYLLNEMNQPFEMSVDIKPKKYLSINAGNFVIKITRGIEMYNEIRCPHINIHVDIGELGTISDGVIPHGVVGQFATRLKGLPRKLVCKQGEGIIDGNYNDYEVSGPFADDFKFNRFNTEPTTEKKYGYGVSRHAISYL